MIFVLQKRTPKWIIYQVLFQPKIENSSWNSLYFSVWSCRIDGLRKICDSPINSMRKTCQFVVSRTYKIQKHEISRSHVSFSVTKIETNGTLNSGTRIQLHLPVFGETCWILWQAFWINHATKKIIFWTSWCIFNCNKHWPRQTFYPYGGLFCRRWQ